MWSFGTTMTLPKDSDHSTSSKPPSPPSPPTTTAPIPAQPRPSLLSGRSLKQLGLFFAGAGFLSLATLITRRSIVRKQLATIPKYFYQSNRPSDKIGSDSSLIALEALNLATLNVVGFGIMMTGGVSWALDISSIDDLRAFARRHIGPAGGKTDEDAEREIEEWVAKILSSRNDKGDASSPSKNGSGEGGG